MRAGADRKPRLVVRTDASVRIGMGHLRRCAVLGRRLNETGVGVHFLTKSDAVDLTNELSAFAEAFEPLNPGLEGQADAARTVEYCRHVGAERAIVDHYHADEAYQRVLLDAGLRWLQFDGAASFPLWADWVVSMSPAADAERYGRLQRRPHTRMMLGPRYAILRDEFLHWRRPRPVPPQAQRLLLTFGGGDDRGAYLLCLEALRKLDGTVSTDVAIGSANPNLQAIAAWTKEYGSQHIKVHIDTPKMAELMAGSDLAIIAGGMTSFETAALGIPSMIVQIAANQKPNAQAWHALGAAIDLGEVDALDPESMALKISSLINDPVRRSALARSALEEVDCQGAERVVAAMSGTSS